jgi:hypothetical protein
MRFIADYEIWPDGINGKKSHVIREVEANDYVDAITMILDYKPPADIRGKIEGVKIFTKGWFDHILIDWATGKKKVVEEEVVLRSNQTINDYKRILEKEDDVEVKIVNP